MRIKITSLFFKNVLILMSGATISQLIPIVISPILTRLYSPEDFGVFAIIMALSTILGSIACGRYELAIVLPKREDYAINIFLLCFVLNIFFSLILFFLIHIYIDNLIVLFKNSELKIWLYTIPISVFFIGLYNILNYFNIRTKNYKDIAHATIIKSFVLAIVQLCFVLIKGGPSGLILGQLLSQFMSNMKLIKNIFSTNIFLKISLLKIFSLSKRYKKFPKYSMWAGLLNISNNYIPTLFFSFYNELTIIGFYLLAQRILGLPSSFISSSFNQVLHKELVDIRKKNAIGEKVNKFIKIFIVLSFPPLVFLMYISPQIIGTIFGNDWVEAWKILAILTPLFALQFVFSPMSTVISIMEWQRIGLIYQFTSFIVSAISLLIGIIYFSPLIAIFFYSISRSILILFYRLIMLKYLEINIISILRLFFINLCIYLSLGYILNELFNNKLYILFFIGTLVYITLYILMLKLYYRRENNVL